ncbi:MAG: SPOR domain-containing protein, partial [Pseudomonadota bacterium]|nr:SPOR domain-containing protein [Pseudomonadota bacterium]
MADLDRGAYAPPTDASPLAFDARQPRRRRPLPITLILSVLILLGLITAMVFIYNQGVRGAGDEPRPVGDPVGPVREPPPAEAQPTDPAGGLDVYTDDGETAAPEAPVFTAPPEAPLARPAPPPSAPAVTGTT